MVALLAQRPGALHASCAACSTRTGRTSAPRSTSSTRWSKLLNENKKSLQDSITGLRGYATAFGEAISSGPWFDAYIQNLTSPGTLAPIISGAIQ